MNKDVRPPAMERAVPATRSTRSLNRDRLTPSEGLTPVAEGWHAEGNRVQFKSEVPLASGWCRGSLPGKPRSSSR